MTKPKTLENLEIYRGEFDKIRDEAIKWIKGLEKRNIYLYVNFDKKERNAMIFVLRDFFNITEEETK